MPDLGNKKCFVIMPFGNRKKEFAKWQDYYETSKTEYEHWKNIYDNIIVEAVTKSGFDIECIRVDQEKGPDDWDDQIVKHMIDDYMAIIDISEKNTNVYWELGVRHALGNRNIIITSDRGNQASDIFGQKSLEYSLKDVTIRNEFFNDLKEYIANIIKEPDKNRNRVQKILHELNLAIRIKNADSKKEPENLNEKNVNIDKVSFSQKRQSEFLYRLNLIYNTINFVKYEGTVTYSNAKVMRALNWRDKKTKSTKTSELINLTKYREGNIFILFNAQVPPVNWESVMVGILTGTRDLGELGAPMIFIIPVIDRISENDKTLMLLRINGYLRKNYRIPKHVSGFISDNTLPTNYKIELWDENKIDELEIHYGFK